MAFVTIQRLGSERSSGSLDWREQGGTEVKLESTQHKKSPQERNEEPIKGVNKKVRGQAHASKRSLWHLCSKYFQDLFRNLTASIAKWKQKCFAAFLPTSRQSAHGQLNTVQGILPSVSAL